MAKNSKSRIEANNKYTKTHYTEKKVRFRNDFFTETVNPYLESKKVSINSLIVNSVKYYIEHDLADREEKSASICGSQPASEEVPGDD